MKSQLSITYKTTIETMTDNRYRVVHIVSIVVFFIAK